MNRVLVTGGAGFIGSHLVKKLVENNFVVTVLDNLERGKINFIHEVLDKINFIECDLRNLEQIKTFFLNQDIVIHLASKVGGIGTYLSNPFDILNSNMVIDNNVLTSSIKSGVKKYFYASSAHVYPKELQNVPNSPSIQENDAYPANCELSYGWAKLIGEKQLEYLFESKTNMKIAIARFIGIYGPNQDFDISTGSVIPVFSHRAIKHPSIPFIIWGNGEETRSYCYIDDCLDCIFKMIEKLDEMPFIGPLNVGKTERVKISEIAEKIIRISKKDIVINYDETKKTVIWGQLCDCSLSQKLLNWIPSTTLDEGLKNVYIDIKNRL